MITRPGDHRGHEVIRDPRGVDITDEGAIGGRPPDRGWRARGRALCHGGRHPGRLHYREVGGGEGVGEGDGAAPAVSVEDGAGQRVRGARGQPGLLPGLAWPGYLHVERRGAGVHLDMPGHGRGGGGRVHGGGVVADQLGGGLGPVLTRGWLARLLTHQGHEV